MSIFNGFTKKVSEVAETVAKKSDDLVEVTKINSSINNEKDTIKKSLYELGQTVYKNYCDNPEGLCNYDELCGKIKIAEQNIENYTNKLNELKNIKVCVNCNKEIDSNSTFCPYCGSKQESIPQVETASSSDIKKCKNCSEPLEEGAAFCKSCGHSVNE